ncbi:MAG TPA: hypothetical protein VM938_05960, partial [Acidimicrobiales bacterium]|nr:hypothetical protein [Acidimicrobiales bacterium]
MIALKMAVTLVAWACPLLVCPPPLFEAVGLPVPSLPVFARLLGAAYLALLVVYALGWADARAG